MIYFKSIDEIERIKESSLLVCKTIAHIGKHIQPGITTLELDAIAEKFILESCAKPAFKGFKGFPNSICASVNEMVVHGIPNKKPILDSDIVSIDIGVELNGFFGDSAYSFAMANCSLENIDLLKATKKSLFLGIEKAKIGNRVGDIGFAIQDYIEKQNSYHIVRELVGHGVGKFIHERPDVPNYGTRGSGVALQAGMVLAIEPMVNLKTRKIVQRNDGWTISTKDGSPSAHYELMVAITKEGNQLLNHFDEIESVEKENNYLTNLKNNITALN